MLLSSWSDAINESFLYSKALFFTVFLISSLTVFLRVRKLFKFPLRLFKSASAAVNESPSGNVAPVRYLVRIQP